MTQNVSAKPPACLGLRATDRTMRSTLCSLAFLGVCLLGGGGCAPSAHCDHGTCTCERGTSCDVACASPPCALNCAGDNPHCNGACANGDCSCGTASACSFTCGAPPCHVACDDRSTCEGHCANGDCTCGMGSTCSFSCDAPPCHVTCDGSNPRCAGTCANGTCHCGAGSTCDFTCASGPCHVECEAGASCLVHCPPGTAGTQNCDVITCAAGSTQTCSDGVTLACGASCPAH